MLLFSHTLTGAVFLVFFLFPLQIPEADTMNLTDMILDIEQHIEVNAPIAEVFDGVVKQFSERSITPDGQPLPLKLELRPGGRWYRDLGDDAGHLWGTVQVLKPPHLLYAL